MSFEKYAGYLVFTLLCVLTTQSTGSENCVIAKLLERKPASFDDPAWENAEIYTFGRLNEKQPEIKNKTFVKFGYNSENLYIGVKCFETYDTSKLVKKEKVYGGDAIEIFLSPSLSPDVSEKGEEYLQFVVDFAGNKWDAKGFRVIGNLDPKFDARWQVKTNVKNDYWEVLVEIDFSNFKTWNVSNPPEKGDIWLIKVFRTYPAKNNNPAETSGLFPASSFHSLEDFGKLAFSFFDQRIIQANEIRELEKRTKEILQEYDRMRQETKKIFSPYLEEILKENERIKNLISTGKTINRNEYEKLHSRLRKAELLNNHIQIASEIQSKLGLKKLPNFGFTFSHGYTRFYKDIPYKGKITTEIVMEMAKGERRSFQLAIFPILNEIKNVSITVNLKEMQPFIKTGRVEYVDISPYSYSKAIKTSFFPDPIVDFGNKNTISFNNVRDFETIPFWITIDLPESFKSGSYNGEITINDGKTSINLPMKVNVRNFSIPTRTSVLLHPYVDSCTVLGVYTGYLRERIKGSRLAFDIVDREKYFESVRMLCRNLIEHRITSCTMAAFGIPPWFVVSRKDGKLQCDASFFKETVKVMMDEGIKFIIVSQCPQRYDMVALDVVMESMAKVLQEEGWQEIIWYKVLDEPSKEDLDNWISIAKIAKKHGIKIMTTINRPETIEALVPYLDGYSPAGAPNTNRPFWEVLRKFNVPVWHYDNAKNLVFQNPLHTVWKTIWDVYHWKETGFGYYAYNLWVYWNKGNPWYKMDSYDGLGEEFVIYPPKEYPGYYSNYEGSENAKFYIVSSMRQMAITEAIQGYLYIKKFEETISLLEQKNPAAAKEGRALLEKWDMSFLNRNQHYIDADEFLLAHKEIGDYIEKYSEHE
ncbi:MAG: DUF4091 domain-containing protein [bacterium]|nr:DUF4091 domain-containing protein [bacterium]